MLYNHIRDHTGENKINCSYPGCLFYTNRTSNLKDHMKRRHNVLLETKNLRKLEEIDSFTDNIGELPEYAEPSSVNTGELPEFDDFPLNLGELPINDIPYPDIFGPEY